jgi:hypothetical protein
VAAGPFTISMRSMSAGLMSDSGPMKSTEPRDPLASGFTVGGYGSLFARTPSM